MNKIEKISEGQEGALIFHFGMWSLATITSPIFVTAALQGNLDWLPTSIAILTLVLLSNINLVRTILAFRWRVLAEREVRQRRIQADAIVCGDAPDLPGIAIVDAQRRLIRVNGRIHRFSDVAGIREHTLGFFRLLEIHFRSTNPPARIWLTRHQPADDHIQRMKKMMGLSVSPVPQVGEDVKVSGGN